MAIDPWLPINFTLPDSKITHIGLFEGPEWQILQTQDNGRALIVREALCNQWQDAGLIETGTFGAFQFGEHSFRFISCPSNQTLCPITEAQSPENKADALAFALALKATRDIDEHSPFQDAIYVEQITRLLPTYTISSRTEDDVILGYWLTGGANVSANSFRRLRQSMSWIGAHHLMDIVQAAGFGVSEVAPLKGISPSFAEKTEALTLSTSTEEEKLTSPGRAELFELAGRPDLASFFNEHVIDIVLHRERYKKFGIDFPSAVILYGPPGTGKTFAVERLIDFLGWPSFQIDASSVASPYIHETSKKVAQVFEKAMENSPSVLVIDEMEAFLADREMGSGHHRVEEVAEFLRRIPEAVKNEVLIIAMTNRIDMIDPAIQRRGRFDHVIKVDFANEIEVQSLLDNMLSSIPKELDVDSKPLAQELAGRPLSDVAFAVREGARLAARSGKEKLDQASLLAACYVTPAREREDSEVKRRIGFI